MSWSCHVSHDVKKDVWMLYVWDGTDAPPASLHGKLEDEEHNPFPLHIDRKTLNKFYRVGTVLRVELIKPMKTLAATSATGNWVNFRLCCIVRVVIIHPSQVNNFSSPNGPSEYRMRLTLEDSTARIHAILCDEAWVKFFEGTPPADVLRKKIKILLGVPEHQNADDDSGLGVHRGYSVVYFPGKVKTGEIHFIMHVPPGL